MLTIVGNQKERMNNVLTRNWLTLIALIFGVLCLTIGTGWFPGAFVVGIICVIVGIVLLLF